MRKLTLYIMILALLGSTQSMSLDVFAADKTESKKKIEIVDSRKESEINHKGENMLHASAELSEATAIKTIFPDSVLAELIANTLDMSIDDKVTQEQLTYVNSIFSIDTDIESIEGFQYLSNLAYITLDGNKIADISPLNGLTRIVDLHINAQRITNKAKTIYQGEGDLSIRNNITMIDGSLASPLEISDHGISDPPYIKWSGLSNTASVEYSFDEMISVGIAVTSYSGTVTQPLRYQEKPSQEQTQSDKKKPPRIDTEHRPSQAAAQKPDLTRSPQTGDDSNLLLILFLSFISLSIALTSLVFRKTKY